MPVNKVLDYLKRYKDVSNYYGYGHISIQNWIKYIENLQTENELNDWTIVLNSLRSDNGKDRINIGEYDIFKPTRTLRDDGDSIKFDLYTIKTNNDPTDFREIFTPGTKEYEETDHYDSEKDYEGFDATKALMAIYVVDLFEKKLLNEFDPKTNKQKAIRGNEVKDGKSVCAPAIWFPKTKDYKKSATLYYVSKDYLDKEKKEDDEDSIEIGGDNNA